MPKNPEDFESGVILSRFPLLGLQKMPKSQNVSNMSNEASERTLDPMKHPPDSDSNPNPYIFRFDMIFFNPTRSEDLENQFRTTQSVIH